MNTDDLASRKRDRDHLAAELAEARRQLTAVTDVHRRTAANRDAVAARLDQLYGDVERIADHCDHMLAALDPGQPGYAAGSLLGKVAIRLRAALAPPTHAEETPA